MSKRYIVASLLAGLAFAAQSAVASDLWFYPGHGWLPQPPFSSSVGGGQPGTVIAGPTAAIAGSQSSPAGARDTEASRQVAAPAPYDRSGFDAGYFN
jgi:hypothetical protein